MEPDVSPPRGGSRGASLPRRRDALAGLVVAVGLLLAGWQVVHLHYGALVMPSLPATVDAMARLAADGHLFAAALRTALHALGGFILATAIGLTLGLLAGAFRAVEVVLRPLATMLLGVPAIAWVVLALLWFGSSHATPVLVVVLTTVPIPLLAALEGSHTVDIRLVEMGRAFRATRYGILRDVVAPHVASHLAPALAAAFGLSWKVAVMAEVLGAGAGIGEGLATARANLDTATAMAWIVLAVSSLLAINGLIVRPATARFGRWRPAR